MDSVAASAIFLGLELGLVDRFPVFYDESLFVAESQLGLDHPTLNNLFLAAMDNHGPLQRWLGMAWLELGFASITAIRLVSILSGLLVVVGVWIAARPLGRAAANLSSLVAAVMPGLVVHSAVGIADPLVAAARPGSCSKKGTPMRCSAPSSARWCSIPRRRAGGGLCSRR